MVTIEHIAKKAGVSYSTVSRALMDSPLVNRATKERIQKIAQESGYQVNHIARSLAMRSTTTLGLIVPEVMNYYYPQLIHLLVENARAAGYSMLLSISGAKQQDEAECIQSLYERRADGIILVTGANGLVAREEVVRLHHAGIPLVLLGWIPEGDAFNLVMGDDATGAYALTRHLLALGHRRMVLLGPKEIRGPYDRIRGFQRALREADLPLKETLSLGLYTQQDVKAAVEALLQRSAPPTALFAHQDTMAAWTVKYLQEAGVVLPQQMAVVGFGNQDLAQFITPRLTTVDYPVAAIVEQGLQLLLRRIRRSGDPAPQQIVLTPHLVIRQSCGTAIT
ncbi:MAG TPA: LacI family DNA-binding transcriptional regulator [Chthonomonadaceae bacterium]|nr:LacI family DNA-binding transcriptional regulator [Chthonomonadaceae bacterium]